MKKLVPQSAGQAAGFRHIRKVIEDYFDGRPEDLVWYLYRDMIDNYGSPELFIPLERRYSKRIH